MSGRDSLRYMKRCLALAARAQGRTHPNPMVGAVVVSEGRIVGEGWHRRAGEPHAEALALRQAGGLARGAALYVNLEPCDHQGRTPPCTGAIIGAGIRRVYAACRDPHPLVNGKGFDRLRQSGIEVTAGILQAEAEELNRAFFHHARTGTPYVTLKLASTLDGRIAAPDGSSRWITGEKSRKTVHRMRSRVDAVLVGVGTVVADNPSLTVRGVGRSRHPLRIVLDPSLRTPEDSRILDEGVMGTLMIVIGENVPLQRSRPFTERGVRILRLPERGGAFSWKDLGTALAEAGLLHVLVEGGGKTAASFLREGAVNRLELFLAGKLLGSSAIPSVGDLGVTSLSEAPVLNLRRCRRVGEDIHLTADVK